jgi:hypothetical protein
MINPLQSAAGSILGVCIAAAFFFFLAFPLLLGLLMAVKILPYREWLAILAVAASLATVAASGNYLYNLLYWTSSRFSPAMNIGVCTLTFGTPLFLLILILARSRRRVLWGLGMVLFAGLAILSIGSQFSERKAGDADAYRQGVKPLSSRTGTSLVQWWCDDRTKDRRYLLRGHVPKATPVVLLTDPFSRSFQPQFCTGVASTYWPPVKDPAVLGNVTEVEGLKGCTERWVQGVAVLERSVTIYKAVSFQSLSGALDRQVFTYPVVRQGFEKFGYDPMNFDASRAELKHAIGPRQTEFFVASLQPIRRPPDAFPCADPALLISIHDLGNVQAVLPYCTLNWNVFQLNDDLYIAAITQRPTPPGEDIMNADVTDWLLRIEGTELKQIWPSS